MDPAYHGGSVAFDRVSCATNVRESWPDGQRVRRAQGDAVPKSGRIDGALWIEVISSSKWASPPKTSEYGLAADDYDRMLQISPGDPSVHVREAVALFALGRMEKATHDFYEAIKFYNQTVKFLVSGRRLDEAAKLDRLLARAYNNRGSVFYQLGSIEKAIEDYDQAILLSPRSAEFYTNRAFAFQLLKQDAEARRNFERAIELGFEPASLRPD